MITAKHSIIPLTFLASAIYGGTLQEDITLYLDCESTTNPPPGIAISKSIRTEPGKFGNAFRIERRTINLVPNGNFCSSDMKNWILSDNAGLQEKDGIKNSPCLKLNNDSFATLPMTSWKPEEPHAVSCHAKGKGTLTLTFEQGDQEKVIFKQELNSDWLHCKTVVFPKDIAGTLRFRAKGEIWLDNIMVDAGVGYFNSFSEPLKKRSMDWITMSPDAKHFTPEAGAVSCWIKVPWLDHNIYSTMGSALFSIKGQPKDKTSAPSTIMACTGWNLPNPQAPRTRGTFNLFQFDAKKRRVILTLPFYELKTPGDHWRHIVVNWQRKDGLLHMEMILNGGEQKLKISKPFGPDNTMSKGFIGYFDGGYLNGLLDDFAMFKRPLSDSEILLIYQSQQSLNQTLQLK